jgi:hypothetical protein
MASGGGERWEGDDGLTSGFEMSELKGMSSSKATKSELVKWLNKEDNYLDEKPGPAEEEEEGEGRGNGDYPDLSLISLSTTLQVTVNTSVAEAFDVELEQMDGAMDGGKESVQYFICSSTE